MTAGETKVVNHRVSANKELFEEYQRREKVRKVRIPPASGTSIASRILPL